MKKKKSAQGKEIHNLKSKRLGAQAARGVKGGFLKVRLDNVVVSNVSLSGHGNESPKK